MSPAAAGAYRSAVLAGLGPGDERPSEVVAN